MGKGAFIVKIEIIYLSIYFSISKLNLARSPYVTVPEV